MNEELFQGPRTVLEYLIIAEIIKFCLHDGLGCESDIISAFYAAVVEFAEATDNTLPIGHKTNEQVSTITREYHHNLEVFKTLTIVQLQLNKTTT